MGIKIPPGLIKRGDTWHIQKTIHGQRIRESTGTSDLSVAETFLAHRIEEIRNQRVYGMRPTRTWKDAAARYMAETVKASMRHDIRQLDLLKPYIGDLLLEAVHMGTLQQFLQDRKWLGSRKEGDKRVRPAGNRTKNYALQVVRRILNLAASEWLDEHGRTWLAHAPKIKLLREDDKAEPYPLSWDEQTKFFNELPDHLRNMALFKVNTGCRDQEVCKLRWEWEVEVPKLDTSVFIIPALRVKNRRDRLVVLNDVAMGVVESVRGVHPEYVFTYEGHPLRTMLTSAWKRARKQVGLPHLRVHDLKHTFGRRLRAAGVSFEDRQDLLGHKSGRITTHYSAPELASLIAAANTVCGGERHKSDTMVVLRKKRHLAVVA